MSKLQMLFCGGFLCAFGLMACDVDEKDGDAGTGLDCGDAGAPVCVSDDAGVETCDCPSGAGGAGGEGGAGGQGGAGGGAPEVKDTYVYVIIEDTTAADMVNAKGSPGVDICGIMVHCGATMGSAIEATLDPGTGEVCVGGEMVAGEECSADRGNAESATGEPEAACNTDPVDGLSQYVAIGRAGTLTLKVDPAVFPTGLKGCSVMVTELSPAGATETEGYRVRICADANADDCHPCADPLGEDGNEGDHTFEVPATCP